MFKRTKVSILLLTVIIALSTVSCDLTEKYEKQQNEKIQNYLTEHPDLSFVRKESGLYYCDVVVGTGAPAATHDTAYVKYTAKYLNGTKFDTNVGKSDTLIFPINEGNMIAGFEEGITYMNEGGQAILLMPSDLAYGNSGYVMPAYTPIIFEVSLVKVASQYGK